MESQTSKLYDLLKDGLPHRTDEIMEKVYGNDHLGLARCGARIWDIKKKYHIEIEGEKDPIKPSLYWYWIKKSEQPTIPPKAPQIANLALPALSVEDIERGQRQLFNLPPLEQKVNLIN